MKIFLYSLAGLVLIAVIVVAVVIYLFYHYGQDLPDHKQLAAYEPDIMTRVHAGDGRVIGGGQLRRRPIGRSGRYIGRGGFLSHRFRRSLNAEIEWQDERGHSESQDKYTPNPKPPFHSPTHTHIFSPF